MNLHSIITILFASADWINSITAIAAFVTALATLKTISEIKKQRENSYHPEISLSNFEFYVYKYDDDESEDDSSLYLYLTKDRLTEDQSKSGYNELTIDINNIGLAVAKQVSWYWESDLMEIYRVIKSNTSSVKWLIDEGDLIVSSEKLNIDWIYSINEENSGGYFNFILPYSIENRKNEIRIPEYFTNLYWIYKTKTFFPEETESELEYPPIMLHIGYTDIHDKEINKTFLVYLNYSFIANPTSEQIELAKFKLQIIEAL